MCDVQLHQVILLCKNQRKDVTVDLMKYAEAYKLKIYRGKAYHRYRRSTLFTVTNTYNIFIHIKGIYLRYALCKEFKFIKELMDWITDKVNPYANKAPHYQITINNVQGSFPLSSFMNKMTIFDLEKKLMKPTSL